MTDAGEAAEGMYVTIGGDDPNALKNAAGKAFIEAFKAAYKVDHLEAYTAYGAQAYLVLANAIKKSNGTRAVDRQEPLQPELPEGHHRGVQDRRHGRSVARRRHGRPVRGRQEQDHHRHHPAG